MGRLRISAIAVFAAMSATTVHAADMRGLPPPPPIEAPVIEEYGTGWYLRGDVGYRANSTSGATTLLGPQPLNARIEDSYFLGGGVGYKMRWFRADLTVDYGTRTNFHADSAIVSNDFYVKMDNTAILANGYLDLGTWSGFTPYIGGGVGAALVQSMEFQQLSMPTAFPSQVNSKWNFAWAAMAGISYNLSSNFLIDVGYRYLSMGDVPTERNVFDNSVNVQSVVSQEIRVGLRYMID